MLSLFAGLPFHNVYDFNDFLNNLNETGPSFLLDLLLICDSPRALKSASAGLLVDPKIRTKTHDDASFQHRGAHRVTAALEFFLPCFLF